MNTLYIAMYHYTRDLVNSRYPRINGMDIALFRQQIDYMKRNFDIVTMEQVIDYINGTSKLPSKALLLTFDDGYIDNYVFAFPILQEYGIQGSFFIPGKTFSTRALLDVNKIHYTIASSDIHSLLEDVMLEMDYYRGQEYEYEATDILFNKYANANRFDSGEVIFIKRMLQTVLPEQVRNAISSKLFKKYVGVTEEQLAYELYMTEDQIKTLKRNGMFIGVHGYDHYWLGNLSIEKMHEDIDKALEVMEQFIDKKQWAINYPYGNYNKNVIDYVKNKGACIGMTTMPQIAKLNVDCTLLLPRLDCNDFPPKSNNFSKFLIKEECNEKE